jgi:hypothetical protein
MMTLGVTARDAQQILVVLAAPCMPVTEDLVPSWASKEV